MDIPPPYTELDELDLEDFEMEPKEDIPSPSSDTLSSYSHGLVIGIDFGTTYSGIAYAFPQTPNDITVLKAWEGGNYSDKAPSEISYAQQGGSSDGVSYSWGFKAKQDPARFKWFKLMLDPHQNIRVPGLCSMMTDHNRAMPDDPDAVTVVKDYLVGLHGQLKTEIARRFGPDFFDDHSKLYIFTLPAIWSEKAKFQLGKAVKEARFLSDDNEDEIQFMSEPEAAALCCLKAHKPCPVEVGNNIIMADCGGGTVDLISYSIDNLAPLQVSEAAVGEGALCGSVFVNAAFEEFMRETLGHETYENLTPKSREAMLKGFEEEVKHQFSNDPHQELFSVGVPGVPDSVDGSIELGFLALSRRKIVNIFQPVLKQIVALVKRQKSAIERGGGTLKALLLVGGFGKSPYLYNFFKDWARDHGDFHVLQPLNAWTSIARGAVIRGLEMERDLVTTRRARKYYGVAYDTPFLEGIHPIEYRYWDMKRNQYYCSDRVQWFIMKGAEICDNESIDFSFVRDLWRNEYYNRKNHIFCDQLLAYDGDNAPDCAQHPGIATVGSMKSDIWSAPLTAWARLNNGTTEDVMTINFDLRMTIRGALLDFELRCKDEGYGKVIINFDA